MNDTSPRTNNQELHLSQASNLAARTESLDYRNQMLESNLLDVGLYHL